MVEKTATPREESVATGEGSQELKKNSKHKKPRAKKRTAKPQDNSTDAGRWTFPKNTLEDAIRILKAIEDKYAGHPTLAQDVAVAVGFRKPNDWRFLDLLRSANSYGLVSGTGQSATVSLTDTGQDVVAPSTPTERAKALWAAFRKVDDFDKVERFYNGKKIPEDEFFANTLVRQFQIPRERVESFAKVFLDNLAFLRSFTPVSKDSDFRALDDATTSLGTPADKVPSPAIPREARVREFLDTCFVMMPFGAWFDRYYQEIYVPAIKDAGFEPVRADELFTTGSVMEQIWEQIEKAKVLLADLSGKNPNVFYELGLSHAASKPVVFTAAQVDDVPFDLRHLRVIIYEIREPDWGSRLRRSITDYLRNAAKEPAKSIPHPFRKQNDEFESEDSLERATAE